MGTAEYDRGSISWARASHEANMKIVAAAAIGALPRRQGKSAKILDLTDFGPLRLLTGPKDWSRANFGSRAAELASDAGPGGRPARLVDCAFERRDDSCIERRLQSI